MGHDELNNMGQVDLKRNPTSPETPQTSPSPSIIQVSTPSDPDLANEKAQNEVSSTEEPNPVYDQNVDPENLTRQPSGPAYSVFSPSTKRWIAFMASVACFVPPMSANIYYPVLAPIADDLHVSVALVNLTVTSYMVLQAISPTLFGDFGDMAGRRPAFLVAFSIYLVACVGLALQRDYAALLVLRMLQSGGSSGAIALGFAMVADISVSSERGKYMGIVGAGINVGPTIGPVLGGVLTQYFGWASIFWFCVVLISLWLVPYALFVPETCRGVVGNGSIPAQSWNRPVIDLIRRRRNRRHQDTGALSQTESIPAAHPHRKLRFPNPIRSVKIIFEKEMALVLAYNSLLYVAFICVAATLGTLFREIYHFNDLELGLCYLPYGAGCVVASLGQGYVLDWNYRRIASQIGFAIDRHRGDDLLKFPIEKARLQPVYPAVAVGLAALTAYGWVLHFEVGGVAAPLVLQGVIGLTITGSFSVMNTLIVDLFPDAPATATAANNLVRCAMGAVGTAVIEYMIRGMGRGWSFTFLAALCAVLSPMMFLIAKKGPVWRNARRMREEAS
ncbi:major facilitator superfamily transporter [Colletotrichum scovillei]|uniref:Major facilitator superfamily transporter n=1 Tax=Colletotrichum scovillei TaxID=1209932 RepID=A0A9P7UH26_9PEZI|nr:major facilitator superfamily transporter [Colletotrichum scovillei]KAG7065566.1 major facilitator superfamily transporter [Colletotrichum scovillei]KAG7068166.1 major facilitator superfamily transporter [Colletotrichum scovillei]